MIRANGSGPEEDAAGERLDGRSDEELMADLAAGRQEALQALHRRHAPLVFHIACRSLDAAAAEEITQDVFLRVWQKAASYDPAKGAFRPWVLQIAHRRVINELRERGRRPRADAGSEASLVELAAHDSGPEEQVWDQYRRSAIRRALAALPEDQAKALRLAFFQDLSHEEVAQFLAVPLGTAKGRIRLALEKLNAPLAALVAVLVAAVGVSTGVWLHRRAGFRRDERALAMLTGSRMEAMRLEPLAPQGPVEQGPHVNYRAERGGGTVVVTFAHLPPAPAGQAYRLWRLAGGMWQALGDLAPDADGGGRVILEAKVQPWPEALRLTLESRGPAGPAPGGTLVLSWPRGK
jgi:RNA polymerase sigma-70 factor (ECF subfamily)